VIRGVQRPLLSASTNGQAMTTEHIVSLRVCVRYAPLLRTAVSGLVGA
jgi:hypothetical protein